MQKEKLLLIPGPTPVHPRILNALSLPTVSHVSPILVDELKEALESTLSTLGYSFEPQSGIQAAREILESPAH